MEEVSKEGTYILDNPIYDFKTMFIVELKRVEGKLKILFTIDALERGMFDILYNNDEYFKKFLMNFVSDVGKTMNTDKEVVSFFITKSKKKGHLSIHQIGMGQYKDLMSNRSEGWIEWKNAENKQKNNIQIW